VYTASGLQNQRKHSHNRGGISNFFPRGSKNSTVTGWPRDGPPPPWQSHWMFTI